MKPYKYRSKINKYQEGDEVKKKYDELSKYAVLNTYYPFISEYPYTGHSSLSINDPKENYRSYHINKGGKNKNYNLITNNCSDATRCGLEKAFNKKINQFLFTTPGDVQDFALTELKGIPAIKGDSIYNRIEHRYKLDLRPEFRKRYKGESTIYIPLNDEQRETLKQYIKYGNETNDF